MELQAPLRVNMNDYRAVPSMKQGSYLYVRFINAALHDYL